MLTYTKSYYKILNILTLKITCDIKMHCMDREESAEQRPTEKSYKKVLRI